MELDKHEKKYKEYVRMQKRCDELWREIRKLPLIELDEPYQKGWIIKLELREDIRRRADGDIIQKMLDMSFRETTTTSVKHVRMIRQGKKSYYVGNRHYSLFPPRQCISHETYLSLNPSEQKYFHLDRFSYGYLTKGHKTYYGHFPEYWLVIKARPNIITHRRQKGGELEKEYDYLHHKLYHSGEFSEFNINYGKSFPASKDRARVRDDIQKFMKGEIEDIYNLKVPMEYYY